MINEFTIMGKVSKTPEKRSTSSGKSYVNLKVWTSNGKDESGEYRDPDHHDIQIWGKAAETAAKWLKQGDWVIVNGSLKSGKYEDKDGKTVYTYRPHAHRWQFGPKVESAGDIL